MNPKTLLMTSLISVLVLATACAAEDVDDEVADDVDDPDDTAEVEDAADEVEAVELSVGHVWAEDDSQAQAVQTFADEVEELSDGQITLDIFPAGQAGDDREILEGLELGTTDIWVGGAGVYNALTDIGQLYVTPFMFDDVDDMLDTYDGEIGDDINARIAEETDTEVVAYWPRGPRHLTLNAAAETPDDVEGARIRVPENPMFLAGWEAFGASPTPMEFTEVFTALQQGTIDGQENPLSLIHSAGFYEVQSHLNLTAHVIEPLTVAIGQPTLEGLDDAQRDLIWEAAEGAPKEEFGQVVADEEEEFLGLLEDEGMTVVEPDTDTWRDALEGLVEEEFSHLEEFYERIVD